MADFITIHKKVSIIEGGYVNLKSDRGGETYAGISRKWHPVWTGWPIVDHMKTLAGFPKNLDRDAELQALVLNFYKAEFFNPLKLFSLKNSEIAYEIYEMAVNIGIKPAALIVQRSLNRLNNNGKRYPDQPEDGKIGPKTLEAIAYWEKNAQPLIRALNGNQFIHYDNLCKNDPTQEVNFVGWLERT